MNLLIAKIALDTLTEKQSDIYQNLACEPYGQELANQVADKLLRTNKGLYHAHRDYCGLGLFVHEGLFTLASVEDGYGVYQVVASFSDKAEFITWLAAENDQSMALYGEQFDNQTITKDRLKWYLEADYSPVWNDYCRYLREKEDERQARLIRAVF